MFMCYLLLCSAATLPVTMKCLEEKQNIDNRIVRFMVPIGATVNMDGGALYEALACIYLAQAYNYDLDFGKYIAVRWANVYHYSSIYDLVHYFYTSFDNSIEEIEILLE